MKRSILIGLVVSMAFVIVAMLVGGTNAGATDKGHSTVNNVVHAGTPNSGGIHALA